jgi:hypothetical protein
VELNVTTPALLFPAVCFLLLAYTNRYVALGRVIRDLCRSYRENHTTDIKREIRVLERQIDLIKIMKFFCISSLGCLILSMLFLFLVLPGSAAWAFGIALLLCMASIVTSFIETAYNGIALKTELRRVERDIGEGETRGSAPSPGSPNRRPDRRER